MSEQKTYPVKPEFADSAWINNEQYLQMYQQSIVNPEGFWREQAVNRIDWIKPFTKVRDVSFDDHNVFIRWFEDGTLNASVNCLDRHLEKRGDQTAIIWEGDEPDQDRTITYKELHEEVSRFGNALRGQGVRKGDVVCIYMPMIPEAAVAMLACARIGAVHSVVFGGFSPDALASRIEDSNAKIVITADEGVRAGRSTPLKKNVDLAAKNPNVSTLETVIVVQRTGGDIEWHEGRDLWYHDLIKMASANCPPEEMNAEDPLFILYTSGSTGKPKGVVHSTGGYLVYASITPWSMVLLR